MVGFNQVPQYKHKVLLCPTREAPCEGRPEQEVIKGTAFAGLLSSGSTSELKPQKLGGADVFTLVCPPEHYCFLLSLIVPFV